MTAGEQLDLALRRAFFVRSRCISMRHEILAAARTCSEVDVDLVAEALDSGAFRRAVTSDFAVARATGIPCSGTIVLPDGRMLCNPGTRTDWIGGTMPRGTPMLVSDDPGVYDVLVADALGCPVSAGRVCTSFAWSRPVRPTVATAAASCQYRSVRSGPLLRMDLMMSTPQLVPADGDPPEDPAAAQVAAAQPDEAGDASTQRTEDPLPESSPSGRDAGAST